MTPASRPRILVVEDEPLLLEVVTAHLEEAGFVVAQAETAEIAFAMIEADATIELLFTDIRLPGAMDGWQLGRAARHLRPGLPIIYATGFTRMQPQLVDGSLFFTKPYRAAALIKAIRTLQAGPAA